MSCKPLVFIPFFLSKLCFDWQLFDKLDRNNDGVLVKDELSNRAIIRVMRPYEQVLGDTRSEEEQDEEEDMRQARWEEEEGEDEQENENELDGWDGEEEEDEKLAEKVAYRDSEHKIRDELWR